LEELADLTGLSPSYLSRLESGSRRLNVDILNRIAGILSCHPGELLPHEPSTAKYSAANWSERPTVETQNTPAFAQDLPLYGLRQQENGAYILELDYAIEWITRPPEMYGITGSFAFTVNNLKTSPRYTGKDHIFAHPTRALTQGCNMLAIMQNNQVYIGNFNGWLEQGSSMPTTLEMTVFENIDDQYFSKSIILNRNEIKSSFRIIGLMEAA
jgi:transcriptional regulator with XRE-family HTH domain